jgi:hypothetical protein
MITLWDLERFCKESEDSRDAMKELWFLFDTTSLYITNPELLQEIQKVTKAFLIALNHPNIKKSDRFAPINIYWVLWKISQISISDVKNKFEKIMDILQSMN